MKNKIEFDNLTDIIMDSNHNWAKHGYMISDTYDLEVKHVEINTGENCPVCATLMFIEDKETWACCETCFIAKYIAKFLGPGTQTLVELSTFVQEMFDDLYYDEEWVYST